MVQAEADPSGAGWIGPQLLQWWSLPDGSMPVGAVIPVGFESYARVLHPPEQKGKRTPAGTRWAELAVRRGATLRAETSWEDVAPQEGAEASSLEPSEGHLPEREAGVLVEVLERWSSSSDDCWFGVWEGYGALDPDRRWPGAARLHLPSRDYVLLRGPVRAASRSFEPSPIHQSANLWWPQDRSWFVATEIDYAWTYVGGPAGCIQELLDDQRLETIAVRSEDRAVGRVAPSGPVRQQRLGISRLFRR